MVEHRVGCVLVVDLQGKLRGIVTQTDFGGEGQGVPFSTEALLQLFSRSLPSGALEKVRRNAQSTMVEEIMVTEVRTANDNTPLEEIARLMLRYDIDHIPVVRDGVPVGIVARHDFLRMIVDL
jgi:CBS domain-containing protein